MGTNPAFLDRSTQSHLGKIFSSALWLQNIGTYPILQSGAPTIRNIILHFCRSFHGSLSRLPTHNAYVSSQHYTQTKIAPAASLSLFQERFAQTRQHLTFLRLCRLDMLTGPASLRIVAQIRKNISSIGGCTYFDMGTYPAFLDRLDLSHHRKIFSALWLQNIGTYPILQHGAPTIQNIILLFCRSLHGSLSRLQVPRTVSILR